MDKKHSCTKCPQRFDRPCRLQRHLETVHEKSRPFQCATCQKRFARKDHFDEHVALHAGERRHKCSVCPLKFTKKLDLEKHVEVHSLAEVFECTVCGAKFRSDAARKVHMGRQHAVPGSSESKRALKRKAPNEPEDPDVTSAQPQHGSKNGRAATPLFEDLVAAEVKRHAHLYDDGHEDYSDKQKRDATWSVIGKALEKRAEFIRDRWKKMTRSMAKDVERAVGETGALERLKAEHRLAFLVPYLVHSTERKNSNDADGSAQHTDGSSLAKERPQLEDVVDDELHPDQSRDDGVNGMQKTTYGYGLEKENEEDAVDAHQGIGAEDASVSNSEVHPGTHRSADEEETIFTPNIRRLIETESDPEDESQRPTVNVVIDPEDTDDEHSSGGAGGVSPRRSGLPELEDHDYALVRDTRLHGSSKDSTVEPIPVMPPLDEYFNSYAEPVIPAEARYVSIRRPIAQRHGKKPEEAPRSLTSSDPERPLGGKGRSEFAPSTRGVTPVPMGGVNQHTPNTANKNDDEELYLDLSSEDVGGARLSAIAGCADCSSPKPGPSRYTQNDEDPDVEEGDDTYVKMLALTLRKMDKAKKARAKAALEEVLESLPL